MNDPVIADYFGAYLGINLTDPLRQVTVASCQRRTVPERGWGYVVPVWVFVTGQQIAISACPALVESATVCAQRLSAITPQCFDVSAVLPVLRELFSERRLRHHAVYTCTKRTLRTVSSAAVRPLTPADVPAFIALSRNIWPEIDVACETTDVLRNIGDGIAFGAFVEGQMVTRCYAPHIAHMQDRVEEIGIDTLAGHQNKGYGRAALAGATGAVLDLGRVPIYRTGAKNAPSRRCSEAVGYDKIADSIEIL